MIAALGAWLKARILAFRHVHRYETWIEMVPGEPGALVRTAFCSICGKYPPK